MALLLRVALCLIFGWCLAFVVIPRASSDSTRAHLLSLVVDVNGAQGAVYAAKDDQGRTMDTAKIIQAPEGDYIAVYHTLRDNDRFHAAIATSTDLLNFQFPVESVLYQTIMVAKSDDSDTLLSWVTPSSEP
ncbi:hypothetical protein B0H19DRAFT_1263418 [Mycena capillaripes]|nr:hypothetical protein B0H19DRAFT_1263418 [Mycena capillaripes]